MFWLIPDLRGRLQVFKTHSFGIPAFEMENKK